MTAMLTALIAVFQVIASIVPTNPSINLTLIPVVIGAIILGPRAAAWLGFVGAVSVIVTPSTFIFYEWNWWGAVLTIVLKGVLSALAAAYLFKLLEKLNKWVAIVAAAAICPIVNTGIFVLGTLIFFKQQITETYSVQGNFLYFILFTYIAFNFVFEFAANVVLSPTIAKIVEIRNNGRK